jgi:hypothetical protein
MASSTPPREEPVPRFAVPPPPPPTGHGERLAVWGHSRKARWRALLGALVGLTVLLAPVVGWYRERLSWIIAACTVVPGWLLMVYGYPSRSIAVGEDWLRVRTSRRDQWVRTDRLTKVLLEYRWTNRLLVLEDGDGRRLRVYLDELRQNPEVYKVFLRAVRHSRGRGLEMNKGTARELGFHAH